MDDEISRLLAELGAATKRFRRTEKAHEESRDAAVEAVIAALRGGARPTDVTERSPFSPAHVRNLAREHGISPRRKGKA
jgi:hypothetical protein